MLQSSPLPLATMALATLGPANTPTDDAVEQADLGRQVVAAKEVRDDDGDQTDKAGAQQSDKHDKDGLLQCRAD